MKESIKKVYQCDFCDKRLFRKDAMERHEVVCSHNPVNYDMCHGCNNCEQYSKTITVDSYDGYFTDERLVTAFKCTKLNLLLYPHKAINIQKKYPETFLGEILMPNHCEHYEGDLPF